MTLFFFKPTEMKRRRPEEEHAVRTRLRAACSHKLNLHSICDGNMTKLVQSHAQAVGVPMEYFFFPLLSTLAGLMANTYVQVNSDWLEPVVLWTAVAATHGTRKSAVIIRLIEQFENLSELSPNFSFHDFLLPEDLELVYKSGCNFSLGLFEDIHEVIKEMLNTTEHKAFCIHQMKNLFDNPLLKCRLSLGGFVHTDKATDLADTSLNLADPLFDRLLLCCPEEVNYHYANLRVPMPGNTPSLQELFKIILTTHNQTKKSKTIYR